MVRFINLVTFVLIVAVLDTRTTKSHAKRLSRCELAEVLLQYEFPRHMIPHWMCIIEHESQRQTHKLFKYNETRYQYGLFQIVTYVHVKHVHYIPGVPLSKWCQQKRPGGICEMMCEALLNEDLKLDVKCAKTLYNYYRFKVWPAASAYCMNRTFFDISRCNKITSKIPKVRIPE